MKQSILLVGHRASGKTVLGRKLAEAISYPFLDLDEVIEQRSGSSAAELVAADEAAFRRRELTTLDELLASGRTPAVISTGGGIEALPYGTVVVWIYREGWQETANSGRRRLRPQMSFEEEVRWMTETREPRFRSLSHAKLHIERGCGEDEAAGRLLLLWRRLGEAAGSNGMRTSWFVPRDASQVGKCLADAALFGAGVEIRSDRFDALPARGVSLLASLRSEDPDFFQRCRAAAAFDCDVRLLEHLKLGGLEPRRLVLSTHPGDVFKEYFQQLLKAREQVVSIYPEWKPFIHLKYAPQVKSWTELRFAWQLYSFYERGGGRLSFFPQGKAWRWMRALRLHRGNEINFISPGVEDISARPPSLDYFLPHLAGSGATTFYGVVGQPVEHSIGDVFHRELSRAEDDGRSAYLKIPLDKSEIDNALHLLPLLGVRGLSVTSPLKRVVVESNFVGCDFDLEAGNTLVYIDGSFMLFDTDRQGMEAVLGNMAGTVEKGSAAVFGSGGVVPAVILALENRGWEPVTVFHARDGWKDADPNGYQLIVNAAGPGADAATGAPPARAWLDLHYRDLASPPETEWYANGMDFYRAQARAQWNIWKNEGQKTSP